MQDFFVIMLIVIVAKSFIWGSEYNFHYRLKYGKEYRDWYYNRQTFNEYLESKNK